MSVSKTIVPFTSQPASGSLSTGVHALDLFLAAPLPRHIDRAIENCIAAYREV